MERSARVLNAHVLWLAVLGLSACSQGKTGSQDALVATVNGNELSMLQLDHVLQRDFQSEKPIANSWDNTAVDSLINEELLVQEALKRRLDKDDEISMAIDQSRRRILAQAYLERMVFPKTSIPVAEQKDFYERHAALFKNHRNFRFVTFTVAQTDISDATKAAVTRAHSPQALRKVLDRRGIRYEVGRATLAAEQLPMNQLDELSHAVVGDVVLSAQDDGKLALMSVARIEETPQSFERARDAIERYLTNVRNERAVEAYLKQARAGAKITRFKDISSSFAINRADPAANPFAVAANE